METDQTQAPGEKTPRTVRQNLEAEMEDLQLRMRRLLEVKENADHLGLLDVSSKILREISGYPS